MKEYIVIVEIPTVVKVQAENEDDAIEKVKNNLIESQQIKPADQFKITVAEEVKV